MSFIQRFVKAILPASTFASMEAESRSWMVVCNACGTTRTLWDIGGIRGGAAGKTSMRLKCTKCAENTWHTIKREDQPNRA
ncbi:MAG: hypothetical protein IPG67_11710 [Acidobacteria bacterium]|nr:hypothetical protein [Acidobacteriota bacterium]